jgi:hypothetical protein
MALYVPYVIYEERPGVHLILQIKTCKRSQIPLWVRGNICELYTCSTVSAVVAVVVLCFLCASSEHPIHELMRGTKFSHPDSEKSLGLPR